MSSETLVNVEFDLKSTVNLPKTDFPQKASLAQREPERLAKWHSIDLYHLIRQARAGHPMFVLHDGPPYANADIHIGTAMNKILKDFIVKSQAMLGFDTPYIPGYDCHGLPIELYVDKKLGAKKAHLDPVAIRHACREHAAEALKRQTKDFQRLGVLGEWDDPYLTMSNTYEAETARLFGRFIELGYVYKGARPVHWCIQDQTALAEAEVEYKEHTSPSIYVKFPLPPDQIKELERRISEADSSYQAQLDSRPVSVLIWTTTPWTLPANLGIAFNPNYKYAAADFGSDVFIVADDLVEAVAEKCGLSQPRRLAVFSGMLVEGLKARHAWLDRPSLLMLGEHVTLGEVEGEETLDRSETDRKGTGKAGTGCVHTAPGHGHDDFVMGQQYRDELQPLYEALQKAGAAGLDGISTIYCPVGNDGRFTKEVERFGGMQVFKANKPIVDFLRETGVLVYSEDYPHRYPHCWRCHKPVIFRATPQWFISMDKHVPGSESLRAGALREVERVNWIPEWGRDRMRNMFSRRPDWCVSRQRVWGVPIPVFYCISCDFTVADPRVVDHVASVFAEHSSDAWYSKEPAELLPAGFACPECGGAEFSKEKDILDVWFESGSSSLAVLECERKLPWPSDIYIEGPDQYRGWFNSSLMVALAAHQQAPYKTVITHGWTVDGEGHAMHKSRGNAISPNEVIGTLGAEILRLWVASSNYREDVRLSNEILKRVVDAYRKIRNTARFALGNLFDFDPERDRLAKSEMLEIDRWALAATSELAGKVREAYQRYEYHTVYHLLYHYCTVTLSAVYFDILKDRLYTYAPKSKGRRSAQTALHEIAETLALLLAPILAFTGDEIWEHIPGDRPISVHIAEFSFAPLEEEQRQLLDRWAQLLDVRSAVQKALEEKREAKVIGASLEARVTLRAGGSLYTLLEKYKDQLPAMLIVSQMALEQGDSEDLAVEVTRADGRKCERCWNWSVTVGRDSRYPTLDDRCIKQIEEGWGEVARLER